MKLKKPWQLAVTVVLVTSLLPFPSPTAKAAVIPPGAVDVGDVIVAPSLYDRQVGMDYYSYYDNWDMSTSKTTITPPAGKTIKAVQIINAADGTVLKDITNDHVGNVYTIGRIDGAHVPVTGDWTSPLGYFAWFRAPNRQYLWAYDLEGVRHWKYDGVYDLPQADGTFANLSFTDTPQDSDFSSTGSFPDEVPGQADFAWAEHNYNFVIDQLQTAIAISIVT